MICEGLFFYLIDEQILVDNHTIPYATNICTEKKITQHVLRNARIWRRKIIVLKIQNIDVKNIILKRIITCHYWFINIFKHFNFDSFYNSVMISPVFIIFIRNVNWVINVKWVTHKRSAHFDYTSRVNIAGQLNS